MIEINWFLLCLLRFLQIFWWVIYFHTHATHILFLLKVLQALLVFSSLPLRNSHLLSPHFSHSFFPPDIFHSLFSYINLIDSSPAIYDKSVPPPKRRGREKLLHRRKYFFFFSMVFLNLPLMFHGLFPCLRFHPFSYNLWIIY